MANFQTRVKINAERNGWKVLKLIRLSENGNPDLILLKNGVTKFIECKEETDTLKRLQESKIDELILFGFDAGCVQSGKGLIYGQLPAELCIE